MLYHTEPDLRMEQVSLTRVTVVRFPCCSGSIPQTHPNAHPSGSHVGGGTDGERDIKPMQDIIVFLHALIQIYTTMEQTATESALTWWQDIMAGSTHNTHL